MAMTPEAFMEGLNAPEALEEILKKKGKELFKELYRLMPSAEIEDYLKAGQWRDEVMKLDLVFLDAHRKEAGAPEPMPLEEVPEPKLPTAFGGIAPISVAKPGLAASVLKPAAVPGATTGTAAAGPAVELRLIALFVAKWKLDPSRTKLLLAKLTPARRRYVLQNFKTTHTGADATAEVEKYVAECDAKNKWVEADKAASAATTTIGVAQTRPTIQPGTGIGGVRPSVVMPKPVGVAPPGGLPAGIKRPISMVTSAINDPNKRPRATTPGIQGPGAAALAARLSATRPRPVFPPTAQSAFGRQVAPPTIRPSIAVRPQMTGALPRSYVQPKPLSIGQQRAPVIRPVMPRPRGW